MNINSFNNSVKQGLKTIQIQTKIVYSGNLVCILRLIRKTSQKSPWNERWIKIIACKYLKIGNLFKNC